MTDVDALARRAGAAARGEAAVRSQHLAAPEPTGSRRPEGDPRRPHWRPAGVVALLAAIAVAVVVLGRQDVAPELSIDPVAPGQRDGLLEIPDVGEVLPGALVDGTPVFVSRPTDDDLLVLDATSPYQTGKLVTYCRSRGWFEDLYHGAAFSAWGDWTDGPAPTGLPAYPFVQLGTAQGQRLRVTGPAGDAPTRDEPRGPEQPPQGPGCEPGWGDPSQALFHQPPADAPRLDAADIPHRQWVWARLVLGGTGDDLRVCDQDGSCPPDAPMAVGVRFHGVEGTAHPASSLWLARRDGAGGVTLLRPGMPGIQQFEASSETVLPVPAAGEVVAASLDDGTPVFVATDEAGEVRVLDATSTAHPTSLVGWCVPDERFVDLYRIGYGIDGHRASPNRGLASGDLRVYLSEVIEVEGGRLGVRVVAAPPDYGRMAEGVPPDGLAICDGDLVAHGPDGPVGQPPMRLSGERWGWVDVPVRRVGEEGLRLCVSGRPACDGEDDPLVATRSALGRDWPDEPVRLLVRPTVDPGRVEIRIPAG